ncbi:MAG: serine/threonine-protein kinase, partial [Planctomycetota bacterium]|nr:serine/threonine-protein kinase [Planctomycetota bacterium]
MSRAAPGDDLAALAGATKPRAAKAEDPIAAMAKAIQPSTRDRLAARETEAPAPPPAPAAPPPAAPASAPAKAGGEPADALVGTVINGFKIVKRIGSGGFGVVYHAFDTSLERSVAIKMLPPKIAKTGKGILDRFLREARSAAKLSHPNIVTIHQICPYKDTFYIVMELVDGGALHDRLVQQRRFEPGEATRIIREAAEGLGHAHRRGIIHRDIKPGNIMLTNDGQAKVSDFGLARDVLQGRDIVGTGHSLGTPRYMSPEQALGDEPTASSDLYSLAATYYALLTGRAPFDASSDRELMKKHVTEDVPDPRQFVPELPVAAFRFFERAMAKQPEERYLTAEEFVEALDRLDFSASGAGGPVTPQSLSAQIGKIAPEDRGSHLTEALGRAVRRSQRERTPTPGQRIASIERVATAPAKKRSPLVWVIVGVVVLLVITGAIVVAYVLANRAKEAGLEAMKNMAQP